MPHIILDIQYVSMLYYTLLFPASSSIDQTTYHSIQYVSMLYYSLLFPASSSIDQTTYHSINTTQCYTILFFCSFHLSYIISFNTSRYNTIESRSVRCGMIRHNMIHPIQLISDIIILLSTEFPPLLY